MCTVFSHVHYQFYVGFAESLIYYSFYHQYHILNPKLIAADKQPSLNDNPINKKINEERNKVHMFEKYFSDLFSLAEDIESKITNAYCPTLSCQYLLNHTSRYSLILFKNINDKLDWKSAFERINQWEHEIIKVTLRLINISFKYKKSSALEQVYDNLKNDLQNLNINKFNQACNNRQSANKIITIIINNSNDKEISEHFEPLLSDAYNQLASDESNDESSDKIIELLKFRYKYKVNKLILFWLGNLSFDPAIIIRILEKNSPIDTTTQSMDIAALIPKSLAETFKFYLSAQDLKYDRFFIIYRDIVNYEVVFNTIILYFLAKDLKHQNDNDKNNYDEFVSNIAKRVYGANKLTIRNIKSINEIATLDEKKQKDIDSNQAIKDLCIHYGIAFDNLKNLYIHVFASLKDNFNEVINKKTRTAPIDEKAITDFYSYMKQSAQQLLNSHNCKKYGNDKEKEKRKMPLFAIKREWFINADTGTDYTRSHLADICNKTFYNNFQSNKDKTMVIFGENREPTIDFEYEEEDLKLNFYYTYNFDFE